MTDTIEELIHEMQRKQARTMIAMHTAMHKANYSNFMKLNDCYWRRDRLLEKLYERQRFEQQHEYLYKR